MRRTAVAWGAAGTVLTGYTVLTIAQPETRFAVPAPGLRVAVEVSGMAILLFAAIALSLPGDEDASPARNAIVAALIVIGLANGVFSVVPAILGERLPVDRGLALYPWVAARYLAGLLFILAALGRPRLTLQLTVGWAIFALAVVELALVATGERLPAPLAVSPDGRTVTVVAPGLHALLQAVPGVLFVTGAVLAARLYRSTGVTIGFWLSVALLVLAVAQLHEILYPAALGPVMTSADALRVSAFGLMLLGALAQVRRLYRSRLRTVRVQQHDLHDQAALVDELTAFAEQEELFRSIVSHELATPLATIRAYSQLIAATVPQPRDAQLEAALTSMDNETTRLLELVGRIDELRDLDVGVDCDLRPVRILPLLLDSRRFVEGLHATHPVSVACDDVRVMADPVRLGQLLRNLVGNAVRFSPPGTPIWLRGKVHGERLVLSVIDDGPGIPPEEHGTVLRRHGRGSNAAGAPGRGLGLYLAQRIAEAHGGRLLLESGGQGAGTTVTIDLEVSA